MSMDIFELPPTSHEVVLVNDPEATHHNGRVLGHAALEGVLALVANVKKAEDAPEICSGCFFVELATGVLSMAFYHDADNPAEAAQMGADIMARAIADAEENRTGAARAV